MLKKFSCILLVFLISLLQIQPVRADASTVVKELKVNSTLTQWVLDEPTNTLYAISDSGKNLLFINSTTMVVEKTLAFSGNPTDIIKDGANLYISLDNVHQIAVVDMNSRTIIQTISTPSDPYRLVKDGSNLYYTDQSCSIYKYDLTNNTEQRISTGAFYHPDLAINTNDHILYIGESGSSGSNMTYYSTTDNKIIGKTNYDNGYGFSYPLRSVIFDGTDVYYASRDFDAASPLRYNGDFGETVISSNNGLVYTDINIYDKATHVKLGSYGYNAALVEASSTTLYIYNLEAGSIKSYTNAGNAISSTNIISLISGKIASPIQSTADSVKISSSHSSLKLNSKLTQWILDEPGNTLYAISNEDKALFFINATTLNLEKSITFASSPTDIIQDQDKLYVALDNINQIAVVDLSSRTISGRLYTTSDPYRLVKETNKLYYAERSQWCDIYSYDLNSNNDEKLPLQSVNEPDLAINTSDHVLYIGESGSSGSDMTYYSTIDNKIIGVTNYGNGYGFEFPARTVLYDGINVYYAGRDFDKVNPLRFNGDFGSYDTIVNVKNGIVYSDKSLYDKYTHQKLGDYGFNAALVATSNTALYIYNQATGTIEGFNNGGSPITSSNVSSLFLGQAAPPIQNTADSIKISSTHSSLKLISKLKQWVLDEPSNTLCCISEDEKAIFFINATTLNLEKCLTFTSSPTDLIQDQGKLYVALDDSKQIAVIDLSSRTISGILFTLSDPYRLVKENSKIYYTGRDQGCYIYAYDLISNFDEKLPVSFVASPDLAINTNDHILYIGESNSSGSNMTYYNTNDNKIIGKTNYDNGYGFPFPERSVIYDGSNVYYAGRDFDAANPLSFNGDFGSSKTILNVRNGIVYSDKSLYDKITHQKLGDYGFNASLVEASNSMLYIYNQATGSIESFNNGGNPITSSNVISLISNQTTETVQNTADSVKISSTHSSLKLNSQLTQWVLDQQSNGLYAISKNDKALFFINPVTLNLEKSITFTSSPTDIIQDQGKLYVTLDDINQIAVVDLSSRTISGILHTSSDPYRLVKDGSKIYYTELDQWCAIYAYDLTTNTDKKLPVPSFCSPDLAINTNDHILYIGDSGVSSSEITYYSTTDDKIIGVSNYDNGFGFYFPERTIIYDGANVFYAGKSFDSINPQILNGDYGSSDKVVNSRNGIVFTDKSLYDKNTHQKLGDYGFNAALVEASNTALYIYNQAAGSIEGFNNGASPITSSNVVSLIAGQAAVPIQTSVKSNRINASVSILQLNSKLLQWELDETTNTLFAISKDDKAIFFINATTLDLEGSISLTSSPTDVVQDQGKLYVALDDINQIVIVDLSSRTITGRLNTSSDPYRLVKDGNKIYYAERDQWCDIYAYDLTSSTDKKLSLQSVYNPDLAINTNDHILYIGESGSSGSNMYYYNTVTNTVLGKSNYQGGYGFPYPGRTILFDGVKVYYAGFDFDKKNPAAILGSYDGEVVFAKYGLALTKTSIYDSSSYTLLVNFGSGIDLYEVSTKAVTYYYDQQNNAIIRVDPNETFSVHFDSQGGTIIDDITAYGDDLIPEPDDPVKAGSVFAGWYKDAQFTTPWNFSTDKITGNTTLYAKWQEPASSKAIGDFVSRLYQQCLNRSADTEGLNYWKTQLISKTNTGADVANNFIFSPEFISKNVSDDDFLNIMYSTFFNRNADSGGKAYWQDKLSNGISRLYVLSCFVNSAEFNNVCTSYGITRGSIQLSKPTDLNPSVTAFVYRFYDRCMSRKPDDSGLNYWVNRLVSGQTTGADISKGFVLSPEFTGKNLSDADFMKVMYRVFFNREPDAAGQNYWINRIKNGTSRTDVLNSFIYSPEFAGVCSGYGIKAK